VLGQRERASARAEPVQQPAVPIADRQGLATTIGSTPASTSRRTAIGTRIASSCASSSATSPASRR